MGEVGFLAAGEEGAEEVLAAERAADEVDCFGLEEGWGEVVGGEALLGGGVAEGAVFRAGGVAVPAAGGEAGGVPAEEGGCLPGGELRGDRGGEVRALVDYPADGFGERGW
jgi:hypothetical protein